MNEGDILTELRAWRDEFARSHGYDLGAIAKVLRDLDIAAGTRVVRGEPRRPVATLSQAAITPNQTQHQTPRKAGPLAR